MIGTPLGGVASLLIFQSRKLLVGQAVEASVRGRFPDVRRIYIESRRVSRTEARPIVAA